MNPYSLIYKLLINNIKSSTILLFLNYTNPAPLNKHVK